MKEGEGRGREGRGGMHNSPEELGAVPAEGELFKVVRHKLVPLHLVNGTLFDCVPPTRLPLRELGHPSIVSAFLP